MNSEIEYSIWKVQYSCVNCKQVIGSYDRAYNNGVCPWCGHQTRGTICETTKEVVREVYELRPVFFGLFKQKKFIKTEIKK